jgi:methylmalonyl-CoA mutase cobalamin-binding subunit
MVAERAWVWQKTAAVEAAFAEGGCAVDRAGVATTGTRAVTQAIIDRIPTGD